jgi:hypothetical protein
MLSKKKKKKMFVNDPGLFLVGIYTSASLFKTLALQAQHSESTAELAHSLCFIRF